MRVQWPASKIGHKIRPHLIAVTIANGDVAKIAGGFGVADCTFPKVIHGALAWG